jgi:hypothetical protein
MDDAIEGVSNRSSRGMAAREGGGGGGVPAESTDRSLTRDTVDMESSEESVSLSDGGT